MSYMRVVELFENERYQPTVGFTSKGLLLTDRNAFSSMDGKCGWNSTYDASLALISFGWKWEDGSDWKIDYNFANTDGDGWSYNTSFGAFCESAGSTGGGGSAIKGIMHFVRRRKLVRQQIFTTKYNQSLDPDVTSRRCNNCDSQQIDRISSVLIQALASASIHTFGPTNNVVNEAQCNMLKDGMMHSLLHPLPAEYAEAAAAGRGTDRGPGKGHLMSIPQLIDYRLQRFAEKKHVAPAGASESGGERSSFFRRTSTSSGMSQSQQVEEDTSHILMSPAAEAAARTGSTVSASVASHLESVKIGFSSLLGDSAMDSIVIRMNELSERFFPRAERAELARVALCQLDVFGDYHCRMVIQVTPCGSPTPSPEASSSGVESSEAESGPDAQAKGGGDGDGELSEVPVPVGSSVVHSEICVFAEVGCENPGCMEICSRKWVTHHDSTCTYKVVECSRECGDCCPRRRMGLHLETVCALRPAECNYKELGCSVCDVTARDLPRHMEECAPSHMLLLMLRVKEQQSVIVNLHKQLAETKEQLARHEAHITTNSVGVAAGVVAVAAQAENLNLVENKLDKKIRDTGNYLSSDVSSLRQFISANVNGNGTGNVKK